MIPISIPATKIKAQGTNKGHLKSPCLGNLTESFATKYSWLCHNASSNWSSGSLRFPRIPYYDTCHGCLILFCFLSRHVLKHAQNTSRQFKKIKFISLKNIIVKFSCSTIAFVFLAVIFVVGLLHTPIQCHAD